MLQAVHVIHEEKIVHSDLKPASIPSLFSRSTCVASLGIETFLLFPIERSTLGAIRENTSSVELSDRLYGFRSTVSNTFLYRYRANVHPLLSKTLCKPHIS